jgi:hypothetical protein
MLNSLNQRFKLPYLPDVHALGETERTAGNSRSRLVMVLGEWFEGYHEWHHAWDETARSHKIRIWNPELGQPFATDRESHEIFKQASKILTLYYDTATFEQIYPWHHAAGDFIIQNQDVRVDAKLTTVRDYGPLGIVPEDRQNTPFVSIVYFFLNLGLLMRIDRVDGVGKIVWAGDHSVRAVTEGFFQALQVMDKADRFRLGKVEDLLCLLKSLERKELMTLCNSVMEIYPEKDPEELSLIQAEMEAHVSQLNRVLQSFRLQDLKGGFQ